MEAIDEWETIRTVSGPSVLAVFRATMANFALAFVLTLVFTAVQLTTDVGFSSPGPVVLFVLIFLQLGLIAPLIHYTNAHLLKRELAAGYTTLFGEFPAVVQADKRTGLVIRRIGQKVLNPEERAEQRGRIAEYRKHLSAAGGF